MTTLFDPSVEVEHDATATPRRTIAPGSRIEALTFLYVPFAIAIVLTFARTPDDAFITLRYAWNLVHGNGAVFNAGEYVQGFSSPLHLLVSLPVVAAPDGFVLLAAKVVSLFFGFLALRAGGGLLRDCRLPVWATRLGFLLVATSVVLATSSANGLETSLYTWLLVVLLRRLVAGQGITAPVFTGFLAFLVAATRPDAILMLAALAGVAFAVEHATGLSRRAVWFLGGIIAAAVAVLGSILYYGDPLPNTFYAKNASFSVSMPDGFRYLATTLQPGAWFDAPRLGLADLLLVSQIAFFAIGCWVIVRRMPRFSYAAAAVLAQAVFVLKSGGDWMQVGRFLAPIVIPFVVVQMLGITEVATRLRAYSTESRRVAMCALAVLVVCAALGPWSGATSPVWRSHGRFDDQSLIASGDYTHYSAAWAVLPLVLRCIPPGGSLATTEVGNLGYARKDLHVLDLRGLTDRGIAKHASEESKRTTGVAVPDWSSPRSVAGHEIIRVRPDVVVVLSEEGPAPATALARSYVRRAAFRTGSYGKLIMYVRADRPSLCRSSRFSDQVDSGR